MAFGRLLYDTHMNGPALPSHFVCLAKKGEIQVHWVSQVHSSWGWGSHPGGRSGTYLSLGLDLSVSSN